ncbi:MAG: UDP-N-acetyl-alpha-D-quinovosamine dehydrogenase, partial [Euryarchaeota archaeon]|nr:UDP-N-acetyl-alpha-D-quinovosamine dehydrogenase [Euryarchaeota archaeon]
MGKILVTGATGFVGKALCKRIASNGWHVRGVVRSAEQAANLSAGVEVVQMESIGADTDWSDALAGVDAVVHLAARVHVMQDNATDPLSAFRQVNVAGTERLARMAAKAGVRRFIFLSSIGVNGNITHDQPFIEEDKPRPYSPYTLSKFEAEQVLRRIASETGMEVVIIRAPLVYGPKNPGNILQLLHVIAKGWPLPFASIKNLRSFIFIGNLVDAIITCINHP